MTFNIRGLGWLLPFSGKDTISLKVETQIQSYSSLLSQQFIYDYYSNEIDEWNMTEIDIIEFDVNYSHFFELFTSNIRKIFELTR